MEQKVFNRRELIEPARLRMLSVRSNTRGLLQLFSQLAAIAVTTTLLALLWGSWWGVLPFMAQGILINCLYAGQHEMSHYTAFRSRWLNEWVGEIIGFFVIYPAKWDRWFHMAHHKHTQDWGKDPELLIRPPYTRWTWLLNMSSVLYWYGRIRSTLRCAFGKIPPYAWWLTATQPREVVAEARWYVAGYVLILLLSLWFRTPVALQFWLAPMFLMKWVHQFQNVGEHTGLSHHGLDTMRNTRTLTGPAVVRWLVWNMSYHAAHHTFPGVPFHRLPELQTTVMSAVKHPTPVASYLGAQREIAKLLSNRTRDPKVAI
ncbi:MAG: fatty acid desaturase [Parvibaculaceae bacterium]|nr:fatty acid desaturase [Parvibaculaceae bacterium]